MTSAGDRLTMYTVGTIPCVVVMGVGTIRYACGGSHGRAHALGSRSAPGEGVRHAAGEKKGGKTSRLMEPRLSPISWGLPHAILGRKTQQKVEIQKFIFLRYGKNQPTVAAVPASATFSLSEVTGTTTSILPCWV